MPDSNRVSLQQLSDYIKAAQAMKSQQGVMAPPQGGRGTFAPRSPGNAWSWLFNGGHFREEETPHPGWAGSNFGQEAYAPEQQGLPSPIAPWQHGPPPQMTLEQFINGRMQPNRSPASPSPQGGVRG